MAAEQNHSSAGKSVTSDRRRRLRIQSETPGWVMPDDGKLNDPWEVRVRDLSRCGIGFDSFEQLPQGEIRRIRIGRGPLELARRFRVARCHPGHNGAYRIGGEFV